jgi:hypothetical protein
METDTVEISSSLFSSNTESVQNQLHGEEHEDLLTHTDFAKSYDNDVREEHYQACIQNADFLEACQKDWPMSQTKGSPFIYNDGQDAAVAGRSEIGQEIEAAKPLPFWRTFVTTYGMLKEFGIGIPAAAKERQPEAMCGFYTQMSHHHCEAYLDVQGLDIQEYEPTTMPDENKIFAGVAKQGIYPRSAEKYRRWLLWYCGRLRIPGDHVRMHAEDCRAWSGAYDEMDDERGTTGCGYHLHSLVDWDSTEDVGSGAVGEGAEL